ncbi:MAG: AsmA family protein [Nitrospirales bacterium]
MVAVAIVLVLSILILLSLPFLLDLNRYRDQYLPVLEQALHRKVEVEDVRLTLFPTLGVQLREVVIADDPAFGSNPFLTVPSVQVAVQWKPLLQRRVQVERVVVEQAIVQVIRSAKGDLNISTIGHVPTSSRIATEKADTRDSVSSLFGVLAVKQVFFSGGTLQFEDRTHQPVKTYQIDNLTLNTESVAIGETAIMKLQGMLLPYQMPFDITGRFGPLQANLDIPHLDINGLVGKVAVMIQGELIDGQLTGDIQIPTGSTDDFPIQLGLKPPLGFSQLQAHLVASIFPKSQPATSSEVLIDPLHLNVHLGQSTIHLSGKGTPTRFALVGESPALFSQDFPVSLPVHQPFAIEQVKFSAEIIEGETLNLQSFKAKAFEGMVTAQGVLNRLSPPLTFSTQGSFKDFSPDVLVKVLRPSSLSITGVGEMEWSVKGVVPISTRPTYAGPTRATIRNGEIIGFDLMKAIEDALQISGILGQSTGATRFSVIDARTEFEKDGVTIRELTAHATNFSLRSAGTVGLDQSVNLQGTLSVPQALADSIIRRLPMAKVVKQEGTLVLPFVISGTVKDPVLRLDTKILGKQVQKEVEERLEKVLQGDDQELQKLLGEGKDLLKHLFRK